MSPPDPKRMSAFCFLLGAADALVGDPKTASERWLDAIADLSSALVSADDPDALQPALKTNRNTR